MLLHLLTAAVLAVVAVEPVTTEPIVLENERLSVCFGPSPDGPRLASITYRAAGQTHHFDQAESIALSVVPLDAVGDPKTPVKFRLQNQIRFERFSVDERQTTLTLHFADKLVDATVTYHLEPDAPVLRKEMVCTAGERGAYIAGITHWMLEPTDLSRAWPNRDAFGQPTILLANTHGCFLTLEWPRAKATSIDGDVRIAYRPGYILAPGESRETVGGSIGFFQAPGDSREEKLEAARQAFFEHVAGRVRPEFPFPVKFTTWGPWLGQMREDRILEVLDDLAYVGTDLLHLDAGWQQPDCPYGRLLPKVRGADAETWDRAMTQPERLPGGLLPIARAANERGMKVSLWFDACGSVFVREDEAWAARDQEGEPVYNRMWESRWPEAPRQSLASPYGDRLKEFVVEMIERYDLGGIMFDNNGYAPDYATDRRSLASGANTLDVQLGTILDILDEGERRRPGIYRFYCRGISWPWALLHATHIHAGDPGMSRSMQGAAATDHPARALAFERRLAWQRHYDNFVPPWGIKGDIAGWSVQQRSAIPINLKHTGLLIPSGEGWTQNMFTCFATTAVRDIRFSFRQMPDFDRDILKEWLDWDRRRSRFVLHCRPFLKPESPDDSNRGISGYSHVKDGQGVIYLFNSAFDLRVVEVPIDERIGLRPSDTDVPAYLVYPQKALLGSLAHGQTLRVPIIGKDCVVIEVGLEPPKNQVTREDYERAAASVRRSYQTIFQAPVQELFDAVGQGPVRVEVGDTPRDRRLAVQMLETLGAATGQRFTLDQQTAIRTTEARCRLIVGSQAGLAKHPQVGKIFRETLYNRYIERDDLLYSAPLCTTLPGDGPVTFCLVAPRPEQLACLANDLTTELLKQTRELVSPSTAKQPVQQTFSWKADLADEPSLLRFLPVVRQHGHPALPGDLEMVRFRIEVEHDGRRSVLWQEDIPPFAGPGRGPVPDSFGGAQWWRDRVVSIADFAGQNVTFHFTANHLDGQGHPRLGIGFTRVATLTKLPLPAGERVGVSGANTPVARPL